MSNFAKGFLALAPEKRLLAISYLLTHLVLSGDKSRVQRLMLDFSFVTAKCAAGLVFDLLEDYDKAARLVNSDSLLHLRDAVSVSLPRVSDRPQLIAQSLYNQLVWKAADNIELEGFVCEMREGLHSQAAWLRAAAPLPSSTTKARVAFPLAAPSIVQSIATTRGVFGLATSTGEVILHDLSHGKVLEKRQRGVNQIKILSISDDDLSVAFVDQEGIIHIGSRTSPFRVRTNTIIPEPILNLGERGIIAMCADSSLVLWTPQQNRIVELWSNVVAPLHVLRGYPQSQDVLFVAGEGEQTIGVAHLEQNALRSCISCNVKVIDADLHTNGRYVLLACLDRTLRVFDLSKQAFVAHLAYEQGDYDGLHGAPTRCAFGISDTADRAYVATVEGVIGCWNWQSSNVTRLENYARRREDVVLISFQCITSSRLALATFTECQVIPCDAPERHGNTHASAVTMLAFPSEHELVSLSILDGTIRWWTAEGLKALGHRSSLEPTALATTGDASAIIVGNRRGKVWYQTAGNEDLIATQAYDVDSEPIVALCNLGDNTICVASKSGSLSLLQYHTGRGKTLRARTGYRRQLALYRAGSAGLVWNLYNEDTPHGTQTVTTLVRHSGREKVVFRGAAVNAVSSDGSMLCFAGQSVRVMSKGLFGWKVLWSRDVAVMWAAFLYENRFLAVCLGERPWIEIWRCTTGLPTVAMIEIPPDVTCLACSGSRIALGTRGGALLSLSLELESPMRCQGEQSDEISAPY